jgi:hypothetical protein
MIHSHLTLESVTDPGGVARVQDRDEQFKRATILASSRDDFGIGVANEGAVRKTKGLAIRFVVPFQCAKSGPRGVKIFPPACGDVIVVFDPRSRPV